MSFETELSEGKFSIPECTVCKKIIWPPIEFCNSCYGKMTLKKGDFEGEIIEFSKQNEDYFCIVEFEKIIRIMVESNNKALIKTTINKVESLLMNY